MAICLLPAWLVIAAPRLAVPPEGVAFGEVAVGSNVVGRVEIRNVGSATVSVFRVKACCDVFAFAGLLSRYEMLPDFSLSFFAVAVPLAECVVGPLLVFSRWVRLSAAAVSAMLAVFIIALSQAALRGLDVSCGCFGGASSSGPLPAILRDLLLLVPSIWLAVRPRGGENVV